MTSNDPERRNGAIIFHYSPNAVDLGANYIKVVEDRKILLINVAQ